MSSILRSVKVAPVENGYHFYTPKALPLRLCLTYEGVAGVGTQEVILPYHLDFERSSNPHPVFTLTDPEDGQTLRVAMRTLPVHGTQNLRDLGGYFGANGRQVRYGRLFRSDQLARVTAEGILYLQQLKLKTIIDLRSPPEAKKSPNVDLSSIKTLCCDPSAETAELAASFQASAEEEDRMLVEHVRSQMQDTDPGDGMVSQYRKFATHPTCIAAFGKMMQAICEPECAPILFHCRGGKDRTGFAAMLILSALGVSEEDIIADYMVTRDNRAERTQVKMETYRMYTDDARILDYLQTLLDTTPDYMQTSISEIKKQYHSVENYLKAVLGLTEEQLETMRTTYLY